MSTNERTQRTNGCGQTNSRTDT